MDKSVQAECGILQCLAVFNLELIETWLVAQPGIFAGQAALAKASDAELLARCSEWPVSR